MTPALDQRMMGEALEEARVLFRQFLDTTTERFWTTGGAPALQAAIRA